MSKFRTYIKTISFVLCVAFILGFIAPMTLQSKAMDVDIDYVYKENEISDDALRHPIPLLVVRVSFDANDNGVDDYDPNDKEKLYRDKTASYYGEQWITSDASHWYKILFDSEFNSLYKYYNELSEGRFYFYPAEENYGTINDGIVDIVMNEPHPQSLLEESGEMYDGLTKELAAQYVDEYVDFASFDKNGNGKVEDDELAIAFVFAGYEWAYNSSNRPDSRHAFGVRAHCGGIYYNNKHDGVYILTGKTLVVGEYKNSSTPLTMGTFAHELGHYLGAPDLYDTDSDNWTKYVSDMSLMCKGNHCDAGSGGSGSNPSYMDPYCFILTRLGQSTTVVDGIYTLYSRDSQEGEYNIVRINTPNPTEYYLIENRSNSRLGLSFDKSTSVYKGIVIWHIDEKLAKRGAVNTSTSGHDLGVAILSPKSVSNYECSFYNDGENGKIKYTFLANNPKYEFPVSKTWYTSMTPEQAEGFNLKVEVLSNVGSEMQIVVTGSTGNGIVVNSEVKDVTESSFTIVGQLENPNDVKISKTGIIMYDYSTGSEIIKTLDMADLHEDGTFEVKYEGLAPNTAYKYEAFASGSYGTASTEGYAKTSKVDGYAEVHLISNYKGDNKERIIQVPLGETLSFAFDYEWEGYTFGGFYFDKQWKKQFDLSSTFDNEEKITIYGKWIENKNAVMLNVVGAEVEDMYPAERSNYYRRPVIIPREDDEFIGWFLDAEFTTPYDFTKRVGDEPLTIYAKWKSDEVIIPEETTLEITTTIDVTAATTSTTEVKPQQSGGCKSIIGASSIAILVAVTTLGVAMIKKR